MKELSKLALAGLIGGGVIAAGCSTKEEAPATGGGEKGKNEAGTGQQYSDVHECAGHNTCKGLGGCKVSAEQLAELATAANVPMDKAGAAHGCKGMNECKGLGGCHVDQKTFDELKAKKAGN